MPQPDTDTTTARPFLFSGVNSSVGVATGMGQGSASSGAGLRLFSSVASSPMTARDTNVRVTCRCAGMLYTSVIVTARMLAGSTCSAAVRTGSQAAKARTASSVVVREYCMTETSTIAASTPGSGLACSALTVTGTIWVEPLLSLNGAWVRRAFSTATALPGAARMRVAPAQPGPG